MISSLDSLPPGSDSPADCGLSCSVMPGRSSAGTFSVGPLSDAGRSARVLPHAAVDPDARQRHQRHHQHRRQNDPEDHQALVAAARLGLGRLLVVGDVPLVGVPRCALRPSDAASRRSPNTGWGSGPAAAPAARSPPSPRRRAHREGGSPAPRSAEARSTHAARQPDRSPPNRFPSRADFRSDCNNRSYISYLSRLDSACGGVLFLFFWR